MRHREGDLTPRNLIEPARLAGEAVLRSQNDERLVDLVRAGNDRAFEAIVHRYRRPLLRYCARFLNGPRAEDAVQQTFLNAYRAIKSDERKIDLRPWLYRIAHNAALNALRSQSGVAEEPISEQIDGVERPDQAFERRERLAGVVAAVQSLPPRQRDAIVLHELEGRSYDQIAAELQVTGGAVRQLLSRARTTLRAGAAALVPDALVVRLASGGNGESVATRVAEIVGAGGGAAVLAKVGAAVVVAGAVATGAAEGPLGISHHGTNSPAAAEAAVAQAPGTAGGASGRATVSDPGGAGTSVAGGDLRRAGARAQTVGRAGGRGRGHGSRRDDHRGSGIVEEHGGSGSSGRGGDDREHSGSGSGSSDRSESDHGERSGSGSGSSSDDGRSGSGSGSGSDDSSTGSGSSGSTDSGSSSGSTDSGSSGSGGGSDDAVGANTADTPDGSGGSSGSDDSH